MVSVGFENEVEQQKNVGGIHDRVSVPVTDTAAEQAAAQTTKTSLGSAFVKMNLEAHSARSLNAAGEAYLKTLILDLDAVEIKHRLLPSSNMHVFYGVNGAIGILFTEHMVDVFVSGTNKSIVKAMHEFSQLGPKECGLLIDVIAVDPTDYPKVQTMVRTIINMLKFGVENELFLEALRTCRWRLNTNVNYVRQQLDLLNPHGVPSRVDFGFVLEVQNNLHADLARNNRDMRDIEFTPVAAVGGFTDIVRAPESNMRTEMFLPIIHISDIQANIRNIRMIAPLMTMAFEAMFSARLWMQPYMSFGDRAQNIGKLFFTEDGNPDAITNQDQFINCLRQHFTDPVIVLDIQFGRATLPGLYLAANQDGLRYLNAEIWAFLGKPGKAESTDDLFERPIDVVTGLVNLEGTVVDSRAVDYFTVLPSLYRSNRDLLNRFLMYSEVPEDRMALLREVNFVPSPLYTTSMCALRVSAFAEIASVMEASMDVQVDYTVVQNTYNAGALVESGRRLSDVARSGGSVIAQRFNGRNMHSNLMGNNAFANRRGNLV